MFKSVRARLVSTLLVAAAVLAMTATILVSKYVQNDLERGAIESQNAGLIGQYEIPGAADADDIFIDDGFSVATTDPNGGELFCSTSADCIEAIQAIEAAQLIDDTLPNGEALIVEQEIGLLPAEVALAIVAQLNEAGLREDLQSALNIEAGDNFFLFDEYVGSYFEINLADGSVESRPGTQPSSSDVVVPVESFLAISTFDFGVGGFNPIEDPTFVSATYDFDGLEFTLLAEVSAERQAANRLRQVLIVGSALFVALAGAASWYLTGRALRPVSLITEQVSGITSRSMDERVPQTGTGDEIDQLAITMNSMLQRLEAGDHKRRQFISDAAHELRTPVAVIMSEAEVAKNQESTTENQRFASAILSESLRMDALVEDLLTLARFDENDSVTNQGDTDLDELVLEQAARTRRLPVDIKAVSAGRVAGPTDELDRVVAHILDNAARHGRSQVAVGVSTDKEAETVELWVDDNGLGVDPEHREKIFERFTRLQESRDRDSGGAGLGLAVVAATVEGLGGTVQVTESPSLGGARFVLKFPAAPV